jgi:DNA-binding LacI/PurR family transcriptional regulator
MMRPSDDPPADDRVPRATPAGRDGGAAETDGRHAETEGRGGRAEPAARLPTLEDVAAVAGVSRSTVSNVVRGSSLVAPGTRTRVQAAIDQLGYRPNALARQLQQGRASLVGIVTHDLPNPFMAEIATLVERECLGVGLGPMLCTTDGDPQREEQAVSLLLENRVAGIVFLSYLQDPAGIARRVSGVLPTMFIAATEPWSDSVAVDEALGGELVARHLLGLGHRRLAFVGPTRPDPADRLRAAGFRRVVEEAGGAVVAAVGWDGGEHDPVVDGSSIGWTRILDGSDRPTAIFASSDFLAIDLLDRANGLGVVVPRDLSLVGFDDVSFASFRRIDLTTVHQPRRELVRLGVERLVARIDGRTEGPPVLMLAGLELRVRGTTGPLLGTTSDAPSEATTTG